MTLAVVVLIALLLDLWLGEPRRAHPLAAFGRWADGIERRLNGAEADRFTGVGAWLLAIVPWVLLVTLLGLIEQARLLVEVLVLYLAIGATSLAQHAREVALALHQGELGQARERVQWMVSRNCAELDEAGVARAATESVLENGSDAVFAAIFWFALLGAPGAVLYRLSNTLDAMWGYRNARFLSFGWAAARIDDLLNWLPARLTALSYALVGNTRQGLGCWRRQGRLWESPNAGPVMAAGAGALGVSLGGPAIYHGERVERPQLGLGEAPGAVDIMRAVRLVQGGMLLWLGVLLVGGLLLEW